MLVLSHVLLQDRFSDIVQNETVTIETSIDVIPWQVSKRLHLILLSHKKVI